MVPPPDLSPSLKLMPCLNPNCTKMFKKRGHLDQHYKSSCRDKHSLRHIRASKSQEARQKGLAERNNVKGKKNKMEIQVFDEDDGVLNLQESAVDNLKGFERLLEHGEDATTMFGDAYLESIACAVEEKESEEEQEYLIRNPTEYVSGLSARNSTFVNSNRTVPTTTELNSLVLADIQTRRAYAELLKKIDDDPHYFDNPGGYEDDEEIEEYEAEVEALAREIVKDPEVRGEPVYRTPNYEAMDDGVAGMDEAPPEEEKEALDEEEPTMGNDPFLHFYLRSVDHQKSLKNRPMLLTTDRVQDKVVVSLLKLMKKVNAPLYLYDDIMKWAGDSRAAGYDFGPKFKSRKTLMRDIKKNLKLEPLEPKIRVVKSMLCIQRSIKFPVSSFMEGIHSLLSSPHLMRWDRLLLNKENICGPGNYGSGYVDDYDTSGWHQAAYNNHHKGPNDLVIGIPAFYDGAAVGSQMKNTLYPLTFTLTIFNRKTRARPDANRLLGLTSNVTVGLSKAQKNKLLKTNIALKGGSQHDLHLQLDVMFEELIAIQQQGGIPYRICIEGTHRDVILKPFFCLVIGDCVGADELCGQYASVHNAGRIHRQCMTSFRDSDDPEMECTYVSKEYIESVVNKPDNDADLTAHSLYGVSNAFHKASFGEKSQADVIASGLKETFLTGGIYLATPPEWLHAISKGLLEYGVRYLRTDMLTPTTANSLDSVFQMLSFRLRHQSERGLPRCSFPKGFSDLTKVTASEFNGIAIIIILSLRSDLGIEEMTVNPKNKLSPKELSDFCELIELILCFLSWYKKTDGHKNDELSMKNYTERIRYLLRKMKRVVRRKKGYGMKLKKFHQLLHTVFLMRIHGAMVNSDGGPPERNQKVIKRAYETTQKRVLTGHIQASQQYLDNLAVDMAYERYNGASLNPNRPRIHEDWEAVDEVEENNDIILRGTQYKLSRHPEFGSRLYLKAQKRYATAGDKERVFTNEVLSFLSERILKHIPNNEAGPRELTLFSEHIRKRMMFHASPHYRSVSEWYDWAVFDYGGYKQVAQIFAFVDLGTNNFTEEDLKHIPRTNNVWIGNEDGSDRVGWYAVVNELELNPDHQDHWFTPLAGSRLVGGGKRTHHRNGAFKLSLMDVNYISKPCVVVDHPQGPVNLDPHKVLMMRPPEEWSGLFTNAGGPWEDGDPDLVPLEGGLDEEEEEGEELELDAYCENDDEIEKESDDDDGIEEESDDDDEMEEDTEDDDENDEESDDDDDDDDEIEEESENDHEINEESKDDDDEMDDDDDENEEESHDDDDVDNDTDDDVDDDDDDGGGDAGNINERNRNDEAASGVFI